MKGPKILLEYEDNWVTEMGGWFPGERVIYRGKDLLWELQHQRWMGLFLYGITGRTFSEKQVRLIEGLWSLSTSFLDPRLWNNRIAALAGTARSTGSLGVGAAIAVSEASIYGQRPILMAMDFLLRVREKLNDGIELEDLIRLELGKYRGIPGYGRPVVRNDERIEPVMAFAKELGFDNGYYVNLAFRIEGILQRWRLHMNVAALSGALCADQGLKLREYYYLTVLCCSAGIMPCVIETHEKAEGAFFPFSCGRIHYEGKTRRPWG